MPRSVTEHVTAPWKPSNLSIYLPKQVRDVIPQGARFRAELVDEGILLRVVGGTAPEPPEPPPAWANGGQPA